MRRLVSWPRVLVALAGVGIVAGVLLPAGSAKVGHRQATVNITVTAREFSFTLSKRTVPVGSTVVFNVVNKGKITHNFAISGKKTKNLNPGQSAKLTVKFAKKGQIAYSCTLPGHAQLGMKGKFAVGVKAVAPPPPVSTQPTSTTHPAPTTTGSVGTASTTVNVNMVEYSFQLSQTSIPSGQVTFVIKNSGAEVHNFDINGVKSGALLAPGATETWTVSLAPGQYLYTCDVPFHVDRGMTGTFNVTP
jgi:nitrite reductase (NO-forming)